MPAPPPKNLKANSQPYSVNALLSTDRELWERTCRESLEAFCIEALDDVDQKPAGHHLYLIDELSKVARGEVDRLMIFMPPGSAKTTYASIIFPAWMLAQRKGLDLIGASYNADFANDLSHKIIRLIQEKGSVLKYGLLSDAAQLWRTDNRGQYRAAGAGGGITGRRADLVIIDDPIKGREDADSPVIREKVWKWYRAEVITRLKPKARIVLILTRWHYDDLAGRLLIEQENGADQWRVINLPAIAGLDDQLKRKPGTALWPEWEDEAALERKRIAVGPREWASLYQQSPTLDESALFKTGMLGVIDAAPICSPVIRSWDLAATEKKTSDFTVGLKLGRTAVGSYVILDLVRIRGAPDEVVSTIINTAKLDGRSCQIRLPEEPGQAGKYLTQHLTRALAGYIVHSERESGDKATRANPVASQVNVGNVQMIRTAWNMPLREELALFPLGAHDDIVDALSGAFSIIGLGRPGIHVNPDAGRRMADAGPRR